MNKEKKLAIRDESFGGRVCRYIKENPIADMVVIVAFIMCFTVPNFASMNNFNDLAGNTAIRLLIALGVSGCLITKGTDLSAGRQVGLAACLAAMMLQDITYAARMLPWFPDIPWFAALLIVMVIMGIIGAINGCVIAFLKVPPFIATLGMQTIVYGACQIITNNQPLGGFKKSYSNVALGSLGGFPFLAIFAVIVGVYFLFLYTQTRHGKYMYAIGGNENAAQVAGVSVSASLIRIYILASVMYALAGFLIGSKAGGASTATGQGYELEAIAACTIGGVSVKLNEHFSPIEIGNCLCCAGLFEFALNSARAMRAHHAAYLYNNLSHISLL